MKSLSFALLVVFVAICLISACQPAVEKGIKYIEGGTISEEYSHLSDDSLEKLDLIDFYIDTVIVKKGFWENLGGGRGPVTCYEEIGLGDTVIVTEKHGIAVVGWETFVRKLRS